MMLSENGTKNDRVTAKQYAQVSKSWKPILVTFDRRFLNFMKYLWFNILTAIKDIHILSSYFPPKF